MVLVPEQGLKSFGRDADLQARVRSEVQGELVLKNSHGSGQYHCGALDRVALVLH